MALGKIFDPKISWGTVITVLSIVTGFAVNEITASARAAVQIESVQDGLDETNGRLQNINATLATTVADLNSTRTTVALTAQQTDQTADAFRTISSRLELLIEAVQNVRSDIVRLETRLNLLPTTTTTTTTE